MCDDCPDPEACLQGLTCWKIKETNEARKADIHQ